MAAVGALDLSSPVVWSRDSEAIYIYIYICIYTLSVYNWVNLRLTQFYTKSE